MQEVFYAGSSFTTGDEIAAAFVSAVMRVAEHGRAETVAVPCRNDGAFGSDEESAIATVVLVPGVAAIAVPRPDAGSELIDTQAVLRLRETSPSAYAIPQNDIQYPTDAQASYDFDDWM